MIKKIITKSVVMLVIIIFAIPIFSADNTGTASGLFLKIPVGSRAIGLGGAYTSLADDVNSIYWNPAGLGFAKRNEIMFMHNDYIQDVRYEYLAYCCPFIDYGTFGFNLTYLDAGTFDRTYILNSTTEQFGGGFSANDLAFGISYGNLIYKRMAIGGTLKYIKSKIDNYSATAFAIDLGVQYKPASIVPMKFGFSLKNFGTKLKYQSEKEKLPLTAKLGYNMELGLIKGILLIPSMDLGVSNSSEFQFNIGSELVFVNNYFLRAGYDSINDAGSGVTLGAGIRLNNFTFDYAYVPFSDLGNSHNITFAYGFGRSAKSDIVESEKQRKIFNNILIRKSDVKLLNDVLVLVPIYSYQVKGQLQDVKEIIETNLIQELNPVLSNKLLIRNQIYQYLLMLGTNVIAPQEAMKLGLLTCAENIFYSDIAVMESDRYVLYYRVFNMTEKSNVLEGRIEFDFSQIAEAVKIIVKELGK